MKRNIRYIASFIRSLPDWTEFNSCFEPTKIRISDIDGIVERNGHFLVLDVKKPGVELNTGQRILYRQLAVRDFTVFIVHADSDNDVPSEWLRSGAEAMIADVGKMIVRSVTIFRPGGIQETCDCDNAGLWTLIRDWFLIANKGPHHD